MTVRLEGGCSIQLSYGCFALPGEGLAGPAVEVKTRSEAIGSGWKSSAALHWREGRRFGVLARWKLSHQAIG